MKLNWLCIVRWLNDGSERMWKESVVTAGICEQSYGGGERCAQGAGGEA
jgi:hypothetical protein